MIKLQLIPALHRQRFAATRSLLLGQTWFQPTLDIISWPEIKINFISNLPQVRKNTPLKSWGSWRNGVGTFLSILAITLALTVGGVVFGPKLYHQLVPVETVPQISQEASSPLGGDFSQGTTATNSAALVATKYLPPQDDSLPEGEWVIIPRIGVRTQLLKTENSASALEKGVWWVPDFGGPGEADKPMILAAHRFGYKWWWQSDYWKYHSFYLLPDLQPGDMVEIIADKRKYTYEVYAGEEGEQITDYQADLILYTCKYLKDTVRYFRYARLVNPEVNTQQVSLVQ